MKRCIITLHPLEKGLKPFDLIIYNRSWRELLTIPNDVTPVLAARYPDYHSTIFDVRGV